MYNSYNFADTLSPQLEFLHGHTDTDVLFTAVRSKLEYYNQPYVFWSNDRVASFWETLTKKTLYDLASQMEGYCISGVECKPRTSTVQYTMLHLR